MAGNARPFDVLYVHARYQQLMSESATASARSESIPVGWIHEVWRPSGYSMHLHAFTVRRRPLYRCTVSLKDVRPKGV